MGKTEAHRGPSYSGRSSASGGHKGPQPSSMRGSPPDKTKGRDKKKKRYVDWKTKNKDAYQEHTYWPKMYKTK